jgi:hypothetical protein
LRYAIKLKKLKNMSCNSSTGDLRPAQYNVQLWRNDSWAQTFAITANDVAVDLSGSTILIQVRTKPTSTDVVLSLVTGTSITIGGVGKNEITLNKIVDIAAGNYVYDMNVTFPSGLVKTYIWGTFLVQEDITRL